MEQTILDDEELKIGCKHANDKTLTLGSIDLHYVLQLPGHLKGVSFVCKPFGFDLDMTRRI